MTTFPAYADNFQIYPKDGEASRHLAPLFNGLSRIDFSFSVDDSTVNQGQMASGFDTALENALRAGGATPFNLPLPPGVPQELDFAFSFRGHTVAVEIEKANREKILRDFLKCHIYLHYSADFAVVALPRNYAHKHGVWNLFEFGEERYNECRTYGFGSADKMGRILLLGFDQHEATTNRPLSKATREEMRTKAAPPVAGASRVAALTRFSKP
ncbi:MAG: hypothetical protein HY360_11650 [Verrucomicrobia bacterium]|nr:hypothetical protein [Verrucomicrobiota bacterium]